MKIGNFLVMSSYSRTGSNGKKPTYKAMLDDQVIYDIGTTVPAIVTGQGCIGIAVPYEVHLNQYGTVVFFTLLDAALVSDKMKAHLYKLYSYQSGEFDARPTAGRSDRDTARTGMDAATRMMMGAARDPEEIADGRRIRSAFRRDDDDDTTSLAEMMRRANPGDPFFDD